MKPTDAPLHRLASTPVMGVSLAAVSVLRLDQAGGCAPGNKSYKLAALLDAAGFRGGRVLSFGGPWSNHLHALAAMGAERGFDTVGVVRGAVPAQPGAALVDMHRWGMQLHFVSPGEYRRRADPAWQTGLARHWRAELVLPEGGASVEGALGCRAIGAQLRRRLPSRARVVVAVGTGTTLAGIAMGLGPGRQVLGISALRGAVDLESRVAGLIGPAAAAEWQIAHGDHCGGFARVDAGLRGFMLAFEARQGVPLDPVYTGKAMYAVFNRIARGEWAPQHPVVLVHTGGLQGRRGFDWLSEQPRASCPAQ